MGQRFELLTDSETDQIWSEFYKHISFRPSIALNIPFVFTSPTTYSIYDIKNIMCTGDETKWNAYENQISEVMKELTPCGEYLFALDWQHSCFRFYPHILSNGSTCEKSVYEQPEADLQRQSYNAYYPTFIPNGDYMFFFPGNFEWGYLSHPWHQEVWIYGNGASKCFETCLLDLGIPKIAESNRG